MRYPRVAVEATRWPRSPQSKPSDFGGKRVILHSKQIFDPPFRPQGGLGGKKKVYQSTQTWILCQTWVLEIIRRCFQRAIGDSFQEIKRYSYATDLYKDFSPWLDEHFSCRNAIFDPLWNLQTVSPSIETLIFLQIWSVVAHTVPRVPIKSQHLAPNYCQTIVENHLKNMFFMQFLIHAVLL